MITLTKKYTVILREKRTNISPLIRYYCQSSYTHSGILTTSSEVIHCEPPGGLQSTPFDEFVETCESYAILEPTFEYDIIKLKSSIRTHLRMKMQFSYYQVILGAYVGLVRALSPWKRLTCAAARLYLGLITLAPGFRNSYGCSVFVARMFFNQGIEIVNSTQGKRYHPNCISLGDIERSPSFKIIKVWRRSDEKHRATA